MPSRSQKNAKENIQESQSSQSSQKRKKIEKHADSPGVDSPNSMSTAEFKRKTAELVRYILFADRKKIGIKRADMVKNVLKEHAKVFAQVFEEATKEIKQIFGYDVVQMANEEGKLKGYILTNPLIDSQSNELLNGARDNSNEMGLLLIILSMIFMNEGVLKEGSMWHTLKKFGITKNQKHDIFKDVEKLISQEFVKHNYLEREKVMGKEGPSYQYHIGARSLQEISKRKILEFVSEVYEVDSIESWKVQYEQVVASEQTPDVEMGAV